jgi:hypothetical protein
MTARRLVGAAATGAALAMAGGVAHAEESVRVAVVGGGTDGDAIASVIASRLAPPATAADPDAFRSALGAGALHALPLAAKRHDKDVETLARLRSALRSVHADRAVVVQAEKTRTGTVVHVWLVGAQGNEAALVDEDVRLGAAASLGDEADAAWNAVASALPALQAPAPPTPTEATPAPVMPSAEVSSTKPPDADQGGPTSVAPLVHDRTRAGAMAVLGAALQGGSRHFAYVDRLTPTLRPYDLFAAPLIALSGEVYPFTTARIPGLNGLGATASYARAFGLASEEDRGTRVSTSWQTFALALRERLAVGRAFIVGIDAGYGDTSFAFDKPIQPTAQLPSVHYKVLRGGLDGRFARGDLSVRAAAGYLDVLSTGDFAAVFPRASLGGIDAALGVADQITPTVELSLDLGYTRFFYDLSPQPGDAYVAGGALDEMATVSLGIAYLF